jgi:haloacetate dehalogenase
MTAPAVDLFPGFSARRLSTPCAEVFARIGGAGPPLLLLHGYPQTHVCWHAIARRLARRFTLVICDLPGYGQSRVFSDHAEETAFSKRAMADSFVAAMGALGMERFSVAGHDRGARVAYRLALDQPARVERLAVLSILPTFAMWPRLQNTEYAMKAFRWFFLAQVAPLPEMLIAPTAIQYLHATLSEWTKARNLSAFAPAALAAYEAAFASASAIAASCRDYRAGWTIDRLDDAADLEAGRKIECPTLVLWGHAEFPDETEMLAAWKQICGLVQGRGFDCGHFLPEEATHETVEALSDFLD